MIAAEVRGARSFRITIEAIHMAPIRAVTRVLREQIGPGWEIHVPGPDAPALLDRGL